jgi:hypothetical protein
MTARQTAFQEAALQSKEEAIAEETALIFTLQQENHNKEMKTMKEALETMKGEIARLAKQSQKKGGNTNNKNNYWSPLTKQVDDFDDYYYVMKVEQQQETDPRWEKILEK